MWFWLFGVCASVSCINNEQHEQHEQMTLVVFNLKLSQKDSLISFRQHCGLLLFICYIFTFLKTPLLSRTTDKMSKSLTCDFSSLWVCLCVYACCAAWKVRFFIHHTMCLCVCMMMMMLSTQITSRLFISGCESRLKMFIWLSSWFGECCLCFHSSLNKHVLTAVMALNFLGLFHTFSVITTAKYVRLNKFKVISLKEHVHFCCCFYRYPALCRILGYFP